VLTIVTARTLEPREVGLLGLAVIVVGVISMIGYYPETAAVAARGESDHNSLALAALIIRGFIIAVLLVLLAAAFAPVADYLIGGAEGRAQFRELLLVLAWAPVLECLSGYPQVVLQRRLDLNFLARVQVVQPVVFVGLATVLLLQGRGYLGVAWASLIGTAVSFLMLWARLWLRGWIKLNGWPARGIWREALVGASRVFAGGFGGYLSARLDNLLVAGAMGPAVMSYYSMAWNASRTPTGILSRAIGFVLVPTFARIRNEPERIERGLRECLQYSYLVLAPACAVLFVCASDLVVIVLGPKWTPMVPALRLMSITVLVAPLLDSSNALLVGTGRAQLSAVAAIVRIIGLLLLMRPLVHRWSVSGAAWADLISALASTIALIAVAQAAERGIKWPRDLAILCPVAAALCSGLLAWMAGSYLAPGYVRLASQVAILLVAYPSIVAGIGGRKRLMSLAALLRSVLIDRVRVAESHT
jgi:PST family polysaccharide transporter